MRSLAPEDLVRYGMIPEFIGRLPVVSVLAPLKLADLDRITYLNVLTEKEGSA